MAEPHHKAARPKVYDGSQVVAHAVQSGETLSSIAAAYRMKSWQPLWIYNAEIRKTVGSDPDEIQRGVTIFIPRSPKGYADLIKKLKIVAIQAQYLTDRVKFDLEAQRNEFEAAKVGLDLAGDVLTSFASLGLKAMEAAKAAKAVEVAKAQAKIAQQLSANATTRNFAGKFAELRSKYVAAALAENRGKLLAKADFRHTAGEKAIGALAEYADRKVEHTSSEDAAWFGKTYKIVTTAEASRRAWREVSLAARAGSFALILLDYLKPSAAAEALIWCMSGQTVAGAQEKAGAAIEATQQRTLEHIDSQIAACAAECKRLYGE